MKHYGTYANYLVVLLVLIAGSVFSQEDIEYIDSDACIDCHEESDHQTLITEDIAHSKHSDLECLDCHQDKETIPHDEDSEFAVGCEGCRSCHEEASDEYHAHGRSTIGTCDDMPHCSNCHGDHDVLPSTVKLSKVHPTNLPQTCGKCHENLDLIKKHELLLDHPVTMYESSVHGRATKGGIYVAATCNDCHSTGGSAHKILSPGHDDSAINHFNIPKTCGKCHKGVENDYWEGIHGKLAARGETDTPICTDCHGEHGILSPSDPRSPVSRSLVAEATCSPCHESTILNEKYGIPTGRLTSFVDSYHGLKSKAGDTHVANCASCHGVHRILPSSDPSSTVHPDNLQQTCGDCHPGISKQLANASIHGVGGNGLRTGIADIVAKIYIMAIIIIIGLMVVHWLIDLFRQIKILLKKKPQVRRMTLNEVWQHTFLMFSFLTLVMSGFALRFSDSWLAKIFFGWEGGFELRGVIHRWAAVIFIITVVWHAVYMIFTVRGRQFFRDMIPALKDFTDFFHKISFNLGFRKSEPKFKRFSYIEKAEYWALVWGTVVMIITGFLLWFDNWFIHFLPKGALDVSLVVHYYEAWLAFLAIAVWHMYSTVFNPRIYPMNPSWLTGCMPEEMYEEEFPLHYEEAKKDTQEYINRQIKRMAVDQEILGEKEEE